MDFRKRFSEEFGEDFGKQFGSWFGGSAFSGDASGESNDRNEDEDIAKKFKKQKKMSKKKKILLTVLAVLAALLILAMFVMDFIIEVWQIEEIGSGYVDVFWKNLFCRLAVSLSGFLVVFAVLLANLFLLRKLAFIRHMDVKLLEKKWPYVVFAAVFALIFGGVTSENSYQQLLMALNATDFGVTDPLFGRDIGYYIFVRPFLNTIVSSFQTVFVLQLFLVIGAYAVVFFVSNVGGFKTILKTQKGALTHVLANVLGYYVTTLFSYRLAAEQLMYGNFGGNGGVAGAGYVETHLWLHYYKIAPFFMLAAVLFAAFMLWKKHYKTAIGTVAAVPVVYLLVVLSSVLVQQFVVAPDERNHQMPYISYNMTATKHAFGLDEIKEVQFDFSKPLTDEVVAGNKDELLNTRIIDFNASLTAYNQLQYFRKYYTFNDIDVVPYEINGEETGVFLSARELKKENLEESARSYTNEKFRYTHGFGVVASPFNSVTPEGQPDFVVKDIPPKSTNGMPEVTQPRIYFGESTNDYVIVGSNNKELDYSEGYQDIDYTYRGDAGIQLGFTKKLMFSLYFKDYKMFFSGNVDENSKILLNRNVLERVNKVAPFFRYEGDPCIVIDDNGELKWVIDGFTCSDQYPYAQKFNEVNYIRNSVKAVVDAYSGDVTFYIIDENDPIVKTYQKIYPSLFSNEPIPESLNKHLTVPEGMFSLQSQVYQRYHLDDPGQFYDQSDVWRVSTEKYQNNEVTVTPYFNMFTIEGETEPELVLTLPYVLGDKYNMVGILMLRSTPEHYGEMVLYRIPKSETVYGPMQIENKIDNDPDISREMTLWGQGGSTVIRGNLLVIPFENSVFYVEPVYITSQNNASLPEIKRIIVAYKDEIAMAPTLEEALAKVLKTSDGVNSETLGTETPEETPSQPAEPTTPQNPSAPQDSVETRVQHALDAYDAVQNSAANGDWEQMGKDLEVFDKAMEALR